MELSGTQFNYIKQYTTMKLNGKRLFSMTVMEEQGNKKDIKYVEEVQKWQA